MDKWAADVRDTHAPHAASAPSHAQGPIQCIVGHLFPTVLRREMGTSSSLISVIVFDCSSVRLLDPWRHGGHVARDEQQRRASRRSCSSQVPCAWFNVRENCHKFAPTRERIALVELVSVLR
jgi:hypothetical protein